MCSIRISKILVKNRSHAKQGLFQLFQFLEAFDGMSFTDYLSIYSLFMSPEKYAAVAFPDSFGVTVINIAAL